MTTLIADPQIAWFVLPLLIFCARVCDVSIGTLRLIFIGRGLKYIAPVLGFFEVIIWLVAIGQVMSNITNFVSYIAYGAGYATGTLVGMLIEERLSLGMVIVRVITNQESGLLVQRIRDEGYGVTSIEGEGSTGPVTIIFMTIKRSALSQVVEIINSYQPGAFYTVEDVKSVTEGIFPDHDRNGVFSRYARMLRRFGRV